MGTIGSSGGIWPVTTGGGGGGDIAFTKVNRDNTKEGQKRIVATDKIIPAGWSGIEIVNESLNETIVINGTISLPPGLKFSSQEFTDWASKKVELGGQLTIVANGGTYTYHVVYPTTSAVDVNSI